jgi:hypothetical protein
MPEMMNEIEEKTRGQWSWKKSLMKSLYPTKCGEGITHFKDETEKYKISLTIQPKPLIGSPIQSSTSFVFEKNPITGKVDLDYCSESRNEKDLRRTFQNCTNFRIVFDENEGTIIELTSEHSDSSFNLHYNFKRSYDLKVIVNSINRLIETVLNENILDQESCEYQLSSSAVFPLCHILFRDHKNGTTSVTRDFNVSQRRYDYHLSNMSDIECTNYFSNYAESELYMGPIMTAYATD